MGKKIFLFVLCVAVLIFFMVGSKKIAKLQIKLIEKHGAGITLWGEILTLFVFWIVMSGLIKWAGFWWYKGGFCIGS